MFQPVAYRGKLYAATIVLVMMVAASPSYADNCDFKSLTFGIPQAQLKDLLDINTLEVATKGEGIIRIGGRDICKDLPERSMAELLFLDNHFVQLSIESQNISGELLAVAVKNFGEQDNTQHEKIVTHALWKEENHYSVIYEAYTEGRYDLEKLVITSSEYDSLFEKQNTLDDQAAVDEQKEEENN